MSPACCQSGFHFPGIFLLSPPRHRYFSRPFGRPSRLMRVACWQRKIVGGIQIHFFVCCPLSRTSSHSSSQSSRCVGGPHDTKKPRRYSAVHTTGSSRNAIKLQSAYRPLQPFPPCPPNLQRFSPPAPNIHVASRFGALFATLAFVTVKTEKTIPAKSTITSPHPPRQVPAIPSRIISSPFQISSLRSRSRSTTLYI